MAKAKTTIELLDQLMAIGFDDSAFWLLHHARLRNWHETISAHREYCEKIRSGSGEFLADSENERVQRRLAWVLAKHQKSGKPNGDRAHFQSLAEAAFTGLPPKKRTSVDKRKTSRSPP